MRIGIIGRKGRSRTQGGGRLGRPCRQYDFCPSMLRCGPLAVAVRWAIIVSVVAAALPAVANALPTGLVSTTLPSGSRVPGLPGFNPIFHPVPGPSPTVAQCAKAWNAQGPRLTLLWVAAQKAGRVRIGVAPAGMPLGPVCGVHFYLGARRWLLAQGPWTDRGVPHWQGGIQTLSGRFHSGLLGLLNGSVRSDGTIRCRLRCDTTT